MTENRGKLLNYLFFIFLCLRKSFYCTEEGEDMGVTKTILVNNQNYIALYLEVIIYYTWWSQIALSGQELCWQQCGVVFQTVGFFSDNFDFLSNFTYLKSLLLIQRLGVYLLFYLLYCIDIFFFLLKYQMRSNFIFFQFNIVTELYQRG